MCLEASKQNYVFLKAFQEAGDDGLYFEPMIEKMKKISGHVFEGDEYVFGPVPLLSLVRDFRNSNGIVTSEAGLSMITEHGLAELDFLRNHEVRPEYPNA